MTAMNRRDIITATMALAVLSLTGTPAKADATANADAALDVFGDLTFRVKALLGADQYRGLGALTTIKLAARWPITDIPVSLDEAAAIVAREIRHYGVRDHHLRYLHAPYIVMVPMIQPSGIVLVPHMGLEATFYTTVTAAASGVPTRLGRDLTRMVAFKLGVEPYSADPENTVAFKLATKWRAEEGQDMAPIIDLAEKFVEEILAEGGRDQFVKITSSGVVIDPLTREPVTGFLVHMKR